ncbi:ABC transporter ATP-binding protein [Caldivirga maquilingensis]|uniref:Oligopeptide/dipeptide ABC transporter, ATPase subunit n=1 Tax=Caldivirga maquilingensis (strain ATCC 700844 / DSM 13496 / JCM 10307 / IC-167) TaxID=397948 RepID=A8M8T3_CALMQ|nr:ABC transporter ATP-binding protein [Caldivirga maquilingensis]ABW02152.1 oligopeptide/dipeptide ABC transporter, ATPase subunit [Caldivirga maquilingensis IC-167]
MPEALIRTKELSKWFLAKKYGLLERIFREKPIYVRAVDNVNITVERALTTALVGESGSGKTTLGRLLTTLETPTSGRIFFNNVDVTSLKGHELKRFRTRVQMVFQDPYSSLDPRMRVRDIIAEPLVARGIKGSELSERVFKIMEEVGLEQSLAERRPSDLSGGQRQRVAVARAVISNPEFIVLDEPTSALDVSTQSQVLNLLAELQERHKLTYLLITHNISVARYLSDKIMVMYMGKVVESGDTLNVLKEPQHPYTQALIESIPDIGKRDLKPPSGEVGSLINPPPGCRFHPRCPFAMDICRREEPPMIEVKNGIYVACWLYAKR